MTYYKSPNAFSFDQREDRLGHLAELNKAQMETAIVNANKFGRTDYNGN
jgi:hypothetical protein